MQETGPVFMVDLMLSGKKLKFQANHITLISYSYHADLIEDCSIGPGINKFHDLLS